MNGFKHRALFSNVGRARKSYRTSDLCSYIAEDVAIQIAHHNHIKYLGGVGQFGGPNVNDPMLIFDFWILFGNFIKYLVKQTIGLLHDVVFGEASDLFAVLLFRIFKSVSNNFLATRSADQFKTLYHFVGLLVFDTCV